MDRHRQAYVIPMMIAIIATIALALPASSRAEPRFGDSTWVAPYPEIRGTPEDPGPRVAPRDHERTWETVLRAPFRAAFFPLRLVADGIESLGPLAERVFPPGDLFRQAEPGSRGLAFSPELLGVTATYKQPFGPGSRAALTATWSTADTRKLKFRGHVGEGVSEIGYGTEALYERKPNRRYFGIGNDAPDNSTYFLRRTELATAYGFVGKDHLRRVRLNLGVSEMRPGLGYNGPVGSIRTQDAFGEAQAPFLFRGTSLWWYGSSADLAALDDSLQPSHGAQFRPEIRRCEDSDGSGVRYDWWRLEGRGYLPVFASRRVLAARVIYEGADPRGGSVIPFYRLPESAEDDRFAAYDTGRFRDRRLAVGRLEYRWEIERPVWAFLLGELGEVAPTAGAFSLRAAHPSVGGGLRAKIGELQAARLEIAHGQEGLTLRADLGSEW